MYRLPTNGLHVSWKVLLEKYYYLVGTLYLRKFEVERLERKLGSFKVSALKFLTKNFPMDALMLVTDVGDGLYW